VDVDALCDGREVWIGGIMQHVEEAGVHSGDSACVLPPHSLGGEMLEQIRAATRELALHIGVVGLLNVQYAVLAGELYVLEANPRASRTVPFVAKVIGTPVAKIAARLMAGEKLADFNLKKRKLGHVGVKESVFPFARFPGVDTVLGPEMRSTGEVMGIDRSFEVAFAKSQLGGGTRVPRKGTVFVSVRDIDKTRIAEAVRLLSSIGFKVMATSGTQRFLADFGIPTEKVNKVLEGRPHIVDAIMNGDIQLVFNTTEGPQALADSRSLRRAALLHKVPYYTTLSGAVAAAQGIRAYLGGDLEVRTLQSYFSES
jgi:carbamoyl-phosphate synthase large subunit